MSESPISLRDETGIERFRGTQSPGGGSSPYEHLVFPLAFDTPGIVIPASGPAGIKVADFAVGDVLLSTKNAEDVSFLSIATAWDGIAPTLQTLFGAANQGNLPGSPPGTFSTLDLTLADIDAIFNDPGTLMQPQTQLLGLPQAVCKAPTSLYVYVDDNNGGDPGSSHGEGAIHLFIARAP